MRGIFGWTFLFLLLAGGSSARIWNVTADGTGNALNIQAAIDSCASGDTVLAAPGTYTGAGNRDIDFTGKAIAVMSLSGPDVTIVDCEGSVGEYHRGFYFHSGEDTTSVLQGFTIRNGHADEGGAIYCSSSSPKIHANSFVDNYASDGGGGIRCEHSHSIISGNTFSHNAVSERFALEQARGDYGILQNSHLEELDSWYGGGGICCVEDSSLIEYNFLTGNKTTLGAAISLSGSVIRMRNNVVSENGGAYAEGIVFCYQGTYFIEGNTISNNSTFYNGGGLSCTGGEFHITGNTVRDNRGFGQGHGLGGGVYCGSGTFWIDNNEIKGNSANGAGGLYIAGSGRITNNRISNNMSDDDQPCRGALALDYYSGGVKFGGGISIVGSGPLVVANNIIIGNSAQFGGGISCVNTSPEITENIIAGNYAGQHPCSSPSQPSGIGGGIYCSNSSPVVARNTIYGNSASSNWTNSGAGAGIYCTSASSPVLEQNIIANNRTSDAQGVGGIFCEDASSTPLVSCNDAYDNSNANYGGTIADQTGLNGNFSLDPLFCEAENGEFGLHILSPCAPGRHPDGGDCGLIGALGEACDFVATLLQGYSMSVSPSAVTIIWTLAQAGENLTCSILRVEVEGGEYRELPTAAIARNGMNFTFNDGGFEPGMAYRYRVDAFDSEGRKVLFETTLIVTPAVPLSLYQNFPNPFNPSTTISYYLPENAPVTLAVYDVSGRRIADLVGKAEKKGRHSVAWDGKNESGGTAASGIYFYRLMAGKETVSRKMILLR
jgi:hypothetical protein